MKGFRVNVLSSNLGSLEHKIHPNSLDVCCFLSGKSMMFIAMLLYWSVDFWQVHWRSHVRPALVFITFRAVQMIEKPPFGWICLILNG